MKEKKIWKNGGRPAVSNIFQVESSQNGRVLTQAKSNNFAIERKSR